MQNALVNRGWKFCLIEYCDIHVVKKQCMRHKCRIQSYPQRVKKHFSRLTKVQNPIKDALLGMIFSHTENQYRDRHTRYFLNHHYTRPQTRLSQALPIYSVPRLDFAGRFVYHLPARGAISPFRIANALSPPIALAFHPGAKEIF